MVKKKNGDSSHPAVTLNSALGDAMNDFGEDDDDLVIDETPRQKKKKPLKLRLSVGSLSEYNSENGSATPFYSPNTRDAVAGLYRVEPPARSDLMRYFSFPGMLSISQGEKLPPKLAVKASLKLKKAVSSRLKRTADMKMNKVHQDEDYIYPALG